MLSEIFLGAFSRHLQRILVTGFVRLGNMRLQGQLWLWECDSLRWVLSFFHWQTQILCISNPMQSAHCNPIFLDVDSLFIIVIISVQLWSPPRLLITYFHVISWHADNHYGITVEGTSCTPQGFRPKGTTREFSSYFL